MKMPKETFEGWKKKENDKKNFLTKEGRKVNGQKIRFDSKEEGRTSCAEKTTRVPER